MVLPVLWILALGVPFVRDRYLSQQRAALQARRCAWEHAINGCRSIPNGCEEALAQSGSWSGPTQESETIEATIRAHQRGSLDVLADIPLLGAAIKALFGTTTAASVESRVQSPFDRSRARIDHARFVVLCNEHPIDVFEAARNVMCKHLPLLECAGS